MYNNCIYIYLYIYYIPIYIPLYILYNYIYILATYVPYISHMQGISHIWVILKMSLHYFFKTYDAWDIPYHDR